MWVGYQLKVDVPGIEQAVAAEKHGLDGVGVAEHHGVSQWAPNPLLIAYKLGLATRRIQVGPSPLLLPLYQPQRLAEEAALVQNELKGRLFIGVGAGYLPEDFAHFGLSLKERGPRTEEGIDILRLAWEGRPFSFKSKHHEFEAQICLPVPTTPPPIWVAAGSEAGARRAARKGDGVILDDLRPLSELLMLRDLYRSECDICGTPPNIVLQRRAWVGNPDFAIRQLAREIDAYTKQIVRGSDAAWLGGREGSDFVRSPEKVMLCGTTAEVASQLIHWRDTVGADKLFLKVPFILEAPELGLVVEQIAALGEAVQRARMSANE